MSFVCNDSFTSSLPMLIYFISSLCLIAVAGISNTVLEKIGEDEDLVLEFNRKPFHFSLLSVTLAMGLS